MGKSKIIFGGETLIDLTGDNITKATALKGTTFHDAKGEAQTGECEFDVNSQDATALVAETLEGKTFYARGQKHTGTMPNRGAVTGVISKTTDQFAIAQGYHDGSGKVKIADGELEKFKPENIRKDVILMGIQGSMDGTEGVNAQSVEVTPTVDGQVIVPGAGYNYISQVKMKPMRINSSGNVVTHTDNAMGVTGFIPAKAGDVIEATNYASNVSYTSYIAAYDASNTPTGQLAITTSKSFPITLDEATFGSNFDAIRISGDITDATTIINKVAV